MLLSFDHDLFSIMQADLDFLKILGDKELWCLLEGPVTVAVISLVYFLCGIVMVFLCACACMHRQS